MKTLVVEDDFVSRRLMQSILLPYGPCEVAVNGREAVEAFGAALEEGDPYDLICLDIMMPEMDGHQVLQEIRRIEDERGLTGRETAKVVMTTALDDPRSIMKAFKEQCEDYLVKPIDRAKLLAKVQKLGLID